MEENTSIHADLESRVEMPVIYQGKQILAEQPGCPECPDEDTIFVTAGGTKATFKCRVCEHVWQEDIEEETEE